MGFFFCFEYNVVVFLGVRKYNCSVFVCKIVLDNKFLVDIKVVIKIFFSNFVDKIIVFEMREVLEY